MSEIRQLTADELDAFIQIVSNAYPGIKLNSEEEKQRFKERMQRVGQSEPRVSLYGLFREGQLLGGMRVFDFTMTLHSTSARLGGVGLVAVDLLHKKEHVAKELIHFFLQHFRRQGTSLAGLYPFRPDFYKAMGFGYGTKINQYRFAPASLPRRGSRRHVQLLTREDKQALRDCYQRVQQRTHGLIERLDFELEALFNNPEARIVGFKRAGRVEGYMVFSFKPVNAEHFLQNDLQISELVYESHEALSELLTFLHTQADQVQQIVFSTQDPNVHHLLHDPRDGSGNFIGRLYQQSNLQGLGIMYRVIDTRGVFELLHNHNFNGVSLRLKLTVGDSFLPENDGSLLVHFEQGRPRLVDDGAYDVELRLNVAEFSALLMGSVELSPLYSYGLAEVSQPGVVPLLNQLFRPAQQPICLTLF